MSNLFLDIPDDWTTTQKGSFFEKFISSLIAPMGYTVESQLRFTGMEIDLMARHDINSEKVFIECKAYSDNLAADVLTKLLGNVAVRKVSAGWLFTTCDLTKDGRGMWSDISDDAELSKKVVWYSPDRILDLLIKQNKVKPINYFMSAIGGLTSGDSSLIITPNENIWLIDVVDNGIPKYCLVFDAATGQRIGREAFSKIEAVVKQYSGLEILQEGVSSKEVIVDSTYSSDKVASVLAGDSWEDPRPARPVDFVGREDTITEIMDFFIAVRHATTESRIFALEGPSGWGKSSLLVKLADVLDRQARSEYYAYIVDTRSATTSSFVNEAIRSLMLEAKRIGYIDASNKLEITSYINPIESADIINGLNELHGRGITPILIFDQFEELFSKEELFETFNCIKRLCFAIDADKIDIILGFSWKTDISLPQKHPAYFLWHSLSDRRKSYIIKKFGRPDIMAVIGKAEKNYKGKLSPAIKTRLVDQCQGFPWLLKKLLVHIFSRLPEIASQYELLENELDIELLFKDDLSKLSARQIECLRYIAHHAPALVPDVDSAYGSEVTNSLIQAHLIIRSGMNYSVYWDIFKDYLAENKLPLIPWNKAFQRDPSSSVRLLRSLVTSSFSLSDTAKRINVSVPSCPSSTVWFSIAICHNHLSPVDNSLALHEPFCEN